MSQRHAATWPLWCIGRALVLLASSSAAACLVNSVQPVHHQTQLQPGQSIVVIGLGLDAPWPHAQYSVVLDEYSLQKQRITGDCFHYNHIRATLPGTRKEVGYFAFLVPAGVYVFSAFNAGASPRSPPQPAAFTAPSGAAVYFGNYIYAGDGIVQIHGNLEAANSAVTATLPRHATLIQAAPELSVQHATAFLCTP